METNGEGKEPDPTLVTPQIFLTEYQALESERDNLLAERDALLKERDDLIKARNEQSEKQTQGWSGSITSRVAQMEDDWERLQVQLAGCSVAALGAASDPAKKGDYGWSPAYQDVLNLRVQYDAMKSEVEKLRATLWDACGTIEWMSGASDFGPEGKAHEGWVKAQSDINRYHALAVNGGKAKS